MVDDTVLLPMSLQFFRYSSTSTPAEEYQKEEILTKEAKSIFPVRDTSQVTAISIKYENVYETEI